jgi:hypothetical protein
MATADLKLIYGGGGSFRPTFFSGAQTIAAASSGTLVTITPPAGKKARLISLGSTAGTPETNIEVSVDGAVVVGPASLNNSVPAGSGAFSVGNIPTAGSGAINNSSIEYLEGISSIVITKTSGSTAVNIYYSYAYGD